MDEQFHKLNRELHEALKRFQQYEEERQRRRQKKLWQAIALPCSLSRALQRLTKDELALIRRNLDLKNISVLPKQPLIQELSRAIPMQVFRHIGVLDHERYDLLDRAAAAGGWINAEEAAMEQIEYYQGLGLLFTGEFQGREVFFMPEEVQSAFLAIDKKKLLPLIERNTQWIRLTAGLLHYYGVLGHRRLDQMLTQLTGETPDTLPFIDVISQAMQYGWDIGYTDWGYCHPDVEDPDKVRREQQNREDVDYYPFTREQLFQAGQPGYIRQTPELRRLLRFLQINYELTADELDETAADCVSIINNADRPLELADYFKENFEFPSFDIVEQLMKHTMELHNNTRQWVLKGHTPLELSGGGQQALPSLSAQPFFSQPPGDNVFDIRTGRKVGRNDPCPCGSGIKYKKCCGK